MIEESLEEPEVVSSATQEARCFRFLRRRRDVFDEVNFDDIGGSDELWTARNCKAARVGKADDGDVGTDDDGTDARERETRGGKGEDEDTTLVEQDEGRGRVVLWTRGNNDGGIATDSLGSGDSESGGKERGATNKDEDMLFASTFLRLRDEVTLDELSAPESSVSGGHDLESSRQVSMLLGDFRFIVGLASALDSTLPTR